MPDAVLALNVGSSSIKSTLFEIAEANRLALLSKGHVGPFPTVMLAAKSAALPPSRSR